MHILRTFLLPRLNAISKRSTSSSGHNLKELLLNMPKDKKHIAEAQRQRLKIKEKGGKFVPAKVTLQVLGTGALGAPRCLYVFSDQARYIFNCGEGTQRLAHEHKMKLARLEHIFITQPVWKNMGGLPGTALTIQDVGVPEIVLHGPNGLAELFKATKRFIVMKNLKVKMAECTELTQFEDNVMSVIYVPLYRIPKFTPIPQTVAEDVVPSSISQESDEHDKSLQIGSETMEASTSTKGNSRKRRRSRSRSKSPKTFEDETDYYAHESKASRSRSRSRTRSSSASGSRTAASPISDETRQMLMEMKDNGVAMAYICRLQPRPGALNLDKCVKLGVPPGPLLGKLKNGEEVALENGVTVKPRDVCEPDDPGPVFIVVDCPSEEYLESLMLNEELQKYQAKASNDEDMAYVVVHFTPKEVVQNSRYRHWIDLFTPSTRHIILNEMNTCMGSISVHRIQHKLNLLCSDMFPLLGDNGTEIVCKGEFTTDKSIKNVSHWDGIILPKTFCNFHVRPKIGFDNSTEIKLCPAEYVDESLAIEGLNEELTKLKATLRIKRRMMNIRPFPEVVFLGTGSCIPNKTRNTSGILLRTDEKSNILIDCGEGTYGQIVRFFGNEQSRQILADTDAVYVSHLHADHHIGLIGFLQGRDRARRLLGLPQKPVYLLAPVQILSWLSFYHLCFEDTDDYYELIPNGDMMAEEYKLNQETKLMLLKTLNMADIKTCYVRHCPNAFGVTFEHKNGYKITYSGDTMPSDNLVQLGMDSDLLIHEATMEDDLAHEAIVKMHSTTSQAITIGSRMRAKHVLLTHFSQRYAKLPRFNDNFADNVGIAFDCMRVKLDELPLVPLLYPALKLMFSEYCEELEQKAVKRQLKQEREKEAKKRASGTTSPNRIEVKIVR